MLDLGGGSMQLTRVEEREAIDARSWPLGAVRMTERFLPDGEKASASRSRRCASTSRPRSSARRGSGEGGRLTGIGGTVRNLAAAAQLAAGLPSYGIQGFRDHARRAGRADRALRGAARAERGDVPGIKAARGDLILAGALVVDTVMEAGGFGLLEATDAGLREGVFFETLLGDPPLVDDVRRATVRNLAAQYDTDFAHAEHVARLALELWDALAAAGLHRGDPKERELLWAAAMLHDIGTAVDYDDHHKHSRYLILTAGMPGYSPARGRADRPGRPLPPQGQPRPGRVLRARPRRRRGPAQPHRRRRRIAEQLERSRDQAVHACDVHRRRRPRRAAAARLRGRHDRPLGDRAPGRRLPQGVRAHPNVLKGSDPLGLLQGAVAAGAGQRRAVVALALGGLVRRLGAHGVP